MIVYFNDLPIRQRYISPELRPSWAMGRVEYALYRHASIARKTSCETLLYKQQGE